MPFLTFLISKLTTIGPSIRILIVILTLVTTTLIFTIYPLFDFSLYPHPFNPAKIDWFTTRLLDERLPIRPEPQVKRWNICACAMVHNEAAYLPEWLEFHRLQGVDHFVLYDYRSTDLLVYLPMFYEDNGVNLVDVIPAKFVPRDLRNEKNHRHDQKLNKHYAMIDCYMRHRNLTEWIVMLDVSQFITSPATTIWKFIESHKEVSSTISMKTLIYGPPTNSTTTFDTWFTPNPHSGGVDLLFEPVAGTFNTFPLVVESNSRRANHKELDSSYQPCTDAAKIEQCDYPVPMVVLVRSNRCQVKNVTECIFNAPNKRIVSLPDDAIKLEMKDLYMKSYPWRPRNLSPAHDSLPVEVRNYSDVPKWYSMVVDAEVGKLAEVIRQRIVKLAPKVFRNVGRDCVPEALQTRQQIKCPMNYPYPYGEFGVNFLRECCATNKDKEGMELRIESTSCWGDANVGCYDDKVKRPWIHQSCCINTDLIHKI